ncbi:hypothetical protein KQX54_014837 [Cotesia glomerata]|uniref:BEN domain-containing protein n=1 Tax=Cotesia glomerata TaxID=32391 RepID=A0AAV7ITP1_COTGL|nr:hypothetical protein KQX54_007440 [Cotesia glomerata]KAH0567839.1 hypothetical protein KQX54_014837 [Cotesia glomerata]
MISRKWPFFRYEVEIGHEGSGVLVSRAQWETANSRNSFQNMAVSLVSSLFENEVLLASNLRGGKSRIDKNAQRKPGLDATIISAITETVKNKFPADYKRTLFGMAINNHLTDLRRKNKVAAAAVADAAVGDEGQNQQG